MKTDCCDKFIDAIQKNHDHCAKWFYENIHDHNLYCNNLSDAVVVANYIIDNYSHFCTIKKEYIDYLCENNIQLDNEKYKELYTNTISCDVNEYIAEYLKSIYRSDLCKNMYEVCNIAVMTEPKLLKFLHDAGYPLDKSNNDLYIRTIEQDDYEMFKCLHEIGCNLNEKIFESASGCHNIDFLKYLYENKCPWNESCCINASRVGLFENLKYLHENGCPWNGSVYKSSYQEDTQLFEYIYEKGCPLDRNDPDICTEVAKSGNVNALKWLREKDCVWNEDVCSESLHCGNVECFKYAYENNAPFNKEKCESKLVEGAVESIQMCNCGHFFEKYISCIIHTHRIGFENFDKIYDSIKTEFSESLQTFLFSELPKLKDPLEHFSA